MDLYFFNLLTVTLSFIAAVQDSILTQLASNFRTNEYRLKFLKSQYLMVISCPLIYKFCLFTWLWVFGLIGLVKYSRNSYIPFAYALVGMAGLVIGKIYLMVNERKLPNDLENKNK